MHELQKTCPHFVMLTKCLPPCCTSAFVSMQTGQMMALSAADCALSAASALTSPAAGPDEDAGPDKDAGPDEDAGLEVDKDDVDPDKVDEDEHAGSDEDEDDVALDDVDDPIRKEPYPVALVAGPLCFDVPSF